MAAPACDMPRHEYALWTPRIHPYVAWYQRRAILLLMLHCTHRHKGIGVLSLDVLVCHVFPRMRVLMM